MRRTEASSPARPERGRRLAAAATLSLALLGAVFARGAGAAALDDTTHFATGADSLTVGAPASDPGRASSSAIAGASSIDRDSIVADNPRVTGIRKVRLIGGEHNVVRSGPGGAFSIVGVYPRKSEFPVIAKHGDWYGIQLSPHQTGWVHASLCRETDDLSDLEFRPNRKIYSRTGSFILSGYTGGYAFDRESNSLVVGGRLGYYVFDRVQVEGGVSWTHVHRPAEIVESLFGLKLESEDFPMLFYHLIATVELLPGRQMVPYLSAGVGSAIMQGESEPSVNFGGGTTLYLAKRYALRWEVRDYQFRTGSASARRLDNNIEFTLGSLLLF